MSTLWKKSTEHLDVDFRISDPSLYYILSFWIIICFSVSSEGNPLYSLIELDNSILSHSFFLHILNTDKIDNFQQLNFLDCRNKKLDISFKKLIDYKIKTFKTFFPYPLNTNVFVSAFLLLLVVSDWMFTNLMIINL